MSRIFALAAALLLVSSRGAAGQEAAHPLVIVDAADEKIERELTNNTDLEFADTPLSDVVDYIKNKHEIELQLDSKGLNDAAVDPSAPVSKSLKGISLHSALHLILDEFDLAFAIVDQVLLITSKEKAGRILATHIYRVGDILGSRDRSRRTTQLIDVIVGTVFPASWDGSGGQGSIKAYRDFLIISQTYAAHEEIRELLEHLQFVLPKEADADDEDDADAEKHAAADDAAVGRDAATVVIYQLRFLTPLEARLAVTTLVMPNTWQGQGGDGAAIAVSSEPLTTGGKSSHPHQPGKRLLAVRQTEQGHAQVRSLLQRLDREFVTFTCAGDRFGNGPAVVSDGSK